MAASSASGSKRRIAWLAAASLAALPGCLPPEYQKYADQLGKELNAVAVVFTGGQSPVAATGPKAASGASGASGPSGSGDEYGSPAARASKANAELLHEVIQVVFMREPKDRAEFGSYVDTLNQGASFEGLYNGFTHSSDYRKLEMVNTGASPEAVKVFGEELAVLEGELAQPTEFSAESAQPLAMPVQPGVDPAQASPTDEGGRQTGNGVNVVEFGKKPEAPAATSTPASAAAVAAAGLPEPAATPKTQAELKGLAEKYSQVFVGASIFTLKRVLGDEALKVMAVKKVYPEKLALWYSKWVVHMASRNVDFGIPQRNLADEGFHYKWALTASADRLQWEVLNRLHRVLNEANRQKQ